MACVIRKHQEMYSYGTCARIINLWFLLTLLLRFLHYSSVSQQTWQLWTVSLRLSQFIRLHGRSRTPVVCHSVRHIFVCKLVHSKCVIIWHDHNPNGLWSHWWIYFHSFHSQQSFHLQCHITVTSQYDYSRSSSPWPRNDFNSPDSASFWVKCTW